MAVVQFGGGKVFSLSHSIQTGSRAQSTSYKMDTEGIKRQGREAEIKNEVVPSLPHKFPWRDI
jgi:hypothetical protein